LPRRILMERQNDLDWVRILAVLLLIPFHTARIFDTFEPFYVKNKDLSAALTYIIIFFFNKWQMAVLFLVEGASSWYAGFLGKGPAVLLLALLVPFVRLLPDIDGKPFFLYLLFFLYGFLLMSEAGLRKSLENNRWVALILALACTAIDYAVALSGARFARFSLPDVLLFFANSFNAWFLLLAILGFAQKYLNADSKLLQYARGAAYPFYLLHQTVIVIVGFYVVQWQAAVLLKFLVICIVSLVLTVLLYDLVVRRVNVIRFLFGMKPKIRRIKAAQPTA
jgi:hypothetical protein